MIMDLDGVDPLTFVAEGLELLPGDPADATSDDLALVTAIVDGAARHAEQIDEARARLLADMHRDPVTTYSDTPRRKALHRQEESLWLGLCLLDRYARFAFAANGIDLDGLSAAKTTTRRTK